MTSYYYRIGVYTFGQQEPSYNALCYTTRQAADLSARDLMSRWMAVKSYEIKRIDQNDVESLGLTIKDRPLILGEGHRCRL